MFAFLCAFWHTPLVANDMRVAEMLNIIARKPRDELNEYVVIDRGAKYDNCHRFVSATANKMSIAGGEWFWGNYFCTQTEAMNHFNSRGA